MKRIKKLTAVLVAAVMLTVLPQANVLTANAAESTSYAIKYVSTEQGWRYQANTGEYDDNKYGNAIVGLSQYLKDGDVVVVYNDLGSTVPLDLGDVHLSNLTYANTQWSVVYAGSVQDCYLLRGTNGALNCDVVNAHVYDTVVFNFNGNVKELTIDSRDKVLSSIGTEGTVDHLYAYSSNSSNVLFDYYDFSAGSLYFENGVFKPKGSYKTAAEHATNPTTGNTPPTTAPSVEYDDVPRTGQSNLYLWLLFASVVCFAGSRALKRSAK